MKKIAPMIALVFLIASCSNGSSGTETSTDSTMNTTRSDTSHEMMMNNGDNMNAGSVDTNGHILKNGKVRMGNDKVLNGDVKLSDSTK